MFKKKKRKQKKNVVKNVKQKQTYEKEYMLNWEKKAVTPTNNTLKQMFNAATKNK